MAAIDVLRELQEVVGPRRAGTQGEKRAQEWLYGKCEKLGLVVELDEFAFIGSENYRPLLMLVTLLLGTASITLSFSWNPLLGLLGFLLILVFHSYLRKRMELQLAREYSRNVIAGMPRSLSAYVEDPAKGPAVVISAHYDTPRSLPEWLNRLIDVMRIIGPMALLGILTYLAFMGLHGLGWLLARLGVAGLTPSLAEAQPWVGLIILLLTIPYLSLRIALSAYMLLGPKRDSPGADDNGSGTAVVLELAQRFVRSRPRNLEIFYAWWGAEERGLFGSRQFVRRFGNQLDRDLLHLVNVDCVGVCQNVSVHTGQGTLRRRRTNPRTVERIEGVAKQLGVKTVRVWESIISGGSSDHAEWMDRGFQSTVSIIREDYRPLSLPAKLVAVLLNIPDANMLDIHHVHTDADTVENINVQALAQSADLVEAYVRSVDASYDGL